MILINLICHQKVSHKRTCLRWFHRKPHVNFLSASDMNIINNYWFLANVVNETFYNGFSSDKFTYTCYKTWNFHLYTWLWYYLFTNQIEQRETQTLFVIKYYFFKWNMFIQKKIRLKQMKKRRVPKQNDNDAFKNRRFKEILIIETMWIFDDISQCNFIQLVSDRRTT